MSKFNNLPFILRMMITSMLVYLVVFLVGSFVTWSIYNPFFWVVKLPDYGNEIRSAIVFVLLAIYIAQYVFVSIIKDLKSK